MRFILASAFFYIPASTYAEVWIETFHLPNHRRNGKSVTSYAEVWIETQKVVFLVLAKQGHLLRGGVD